MQKLFVLLSFVFLRALPACCATPVKDVRVQPISKGNLKKAIRTTALSSLKHMTLISRASASDLNAQAYAEYSALWKNHETNSFANIWRGKTAFLLWQQSLFKGEAGRKTAASYFEVAKFSFERAVLWSPNLPVANLEYGYFLWQYGNNMPYGSKLVKKAVVSAAKDPRAHAILGAMYLNSSGNMYSPKLGEKEMKASLRLDSTYSYARWQLMMFYVRQKRASEAQFQLEQFILLQPTGVASRPDVKMWQAAIRKL